MDYGPARGMPFHKELQFFFVLDSLLDSSEFRSGAVLEVNEVCVVSVQDKKIDWQVSERFEHLECAQLAMNEAEDLRRIENVFDLDEDAVHDLEVVFTKVQEVEDTQLDSGEPIFFGEPQIIA